MQIYMAKDLAFTTMIAQMTSGLIATSTQFSPGAISSITASIVDSNNIQTATNYTIKFTPAHNMPISGAIIIITFPSTITMPTSGCKIPSRSALFDSTTISCTFSGQQVIISNPFATLYVGGNALSLTINYGTNPVSEQDAGAFTISTYVQTSSVNYLVDSGTSAANLIHPIGGEIYKSAEIMVIQPTTYLRDQTYSFFLDFQHTVPQNGYLILTTPAEISVSNYAYVSSTCKRLDTGVIMSCSALSDTQIKISIDSRAFTNGIANTDYFQFSIQGFKNPRSTYPSSQFYFYSYDSSGNRIDQSTANEYFITTMSGVSTITKIAVDNEIKKNGAYTSYTVTVTPNTPIYEGDQMTIRFPSELTMPDYNSLTCDVNDDLNLLLRVDCTKDGNLLTVKFTRSNAISENTPFQFIVNNIRNPGTTTPTSAFTDIMLATVKGSYTYYIAQYTKLDVTVATTSPGDIITKKLVQSNKNPGDTATYTVTFSTFNSIPNTGALLIKAPPVISLIADSGSCYVALTQIVTNVCDIQENFIRIQNAFSIYSRSYNGQVSITFKAINPENNSNLQSLQLEIYTDSSYNYIIDSTDEGLTAVLQCNYPCKRCDLNNPDFCTDCFTDPSFPQFIQKTGSLQTCAYSCSKGYTSNGSKNPKTCSSCNSRCATCAENYQIGDVNVCTSCSKSYPLQYSKQNTCLESCFEGTYQCRPLECCDCVFPCKTCVGSATCRSCFQDSEKPFMYVDKCFADCPVGFTPVGFTCTKCQSPCSTCDRGLLTQCLTCDGSNDQSLLFGRKCLSECPVGTTPSYTNKTQYKCEGCFLGCEKCDQNNNEICLRCSRGLVLYNNTCITDCPFNYLKSKDGTVCEMRTYLLDGSLIWFPFGSAACAIVLISITAFLITGKKSLILSNAVALLSIVECAALCYQIYYAYMYDTNYILILLGSAGIALGLITMNLIFIIYYCARLQFTDISYNYWRQSHYCITIFILLLSMTISFKLYRLLYSRFFSIPFFSANIEDKRAFTRKVQVFNLISVFTFTLPLIGLDVLVLQYLEWGSQLYMTCAESGCIAFVGGIFIIFDNCCMCSRLSYFEEKEELKLKKEAKAKYKIIDQSKSMCDPSMEIDAKADIDLEEEGKRDCLYREDLLKNILKTVKNNQDLHINGDFDLLYTERPDDSQITERVIRRAHSMPNIKVRVPEELQGEDERKTDSFPGSPKQNKEYLNDNTALHNFDTTKILANLRNLKNLQRSMEMQIEYKFDNVYAEEQPPKPPPEEKPALIECEIQTEQFMRQQSSESMRHGSTGRRLVDMQKAQESIDDLEDHKRLTRKRKRQRGKNKNSFYTQIDEEDKDDQISLGHGDDTQRQFLMTAYEQADEDDFSDDSQQNALPFDIGSDLDKTRNILSEKHTRTNKSNKSQTNKSHKSTKSVVFSQMSAQRVSEAALQQHLQPRQLEEEYFNQRTFNINDILGDFVMDWRGAMVKRRQQLEESGYTDINGRTVNERGYLLNEAEQCIISKHNLGLMFKKEDLTSDGDLPMPYRFERFNFNPHEILGNFDYDKQTDKPIILKNKKGQLVDKSLREVNTSGFLIDEQGNIVDNIGRIRFIRPQLNDMGDIPMLFTYKGKPFDIRDIIGTFVRDQMSKQIIINPDAQDKNAFTDKLGRRVNSAGYLVDRIGNIINKNGKIAFFKSQLMFNEPPKLFQFLKFYLHEIQGSFTQDAFGNQVFHYQEDEETGVIQMRDENGHLVNQQGYLIDQDGNIVDIYGKIFLRKELLEMNENKRACQIPKVFRTGVFRTKKPKVEILPEQEQDAFDEQEVVGDQNMIDDFLQDELERLQQKNPMSNLTDDLLPPFNESKDDHIVDIEINPQQEEIKSDGESQITSEIHIFEDHKEDDDMPEPLMDQINEEQHMESKRKRKQSAQARLMKKQVRQGEKVLQAYQIDRPVSSYLPMQYQKRAQSQARERRPKYSAFANNQFESRRDINPQSRPPGILSSTQMNTTQIQSNSDILKKGGQTVLGYTEEFNSLPQRNVLRNQYMISHHHEQDLNQPSEQDHSYNDYLEGDVDQQQLQDMNFQWNTNQGLNQTQERRSKSKLGGKRIRQNEQQVDKVYADEINKYVDLSDGDEDDDAIFNENFNLGRQQQQQRSQSRMKIKQRSKLRMYDIGSSMLDMVSNHSNDSSRSRRARALRPKKQVNRMDSKLRHLENIYLGRDLSSTKHATMKRGVFGATSIRSINKGSKSQTGQHNVRAMQNQYYDYHANERDISPLEDRRDPQNHTQYIGRRRLNDESQNEE